MNEREVNEKEEKRKIVRYGKREEWDERDEEAAGFIGPAITQITVINQERG